MEYNTLRYSKWNPVLRSYWATTLYNLHGALCLCRDSPEERKCQTEDMGMCCNRGWFWFSGLITQIFQKYSQAQSMTLVHSQVETIVNNGSSDIFPVIIWHPYKSSTVPSPTVTSRMCSPLFCYYFTTNRKDDSFVIWIELIMLRYYLRELHFSYYWTHNALYDLNIGFILEKRKLRIVEALTFSSLQNSLYI